MPISPTDDPTTPADLTAPPPGLSAGLSIIWWLYTLNSQSLRTLRAILDAPQTPAAKAAAARVWLDARGPARDKAGRADARRFLRNRIGWPWPRK